MLFVVKGIPCGPIAVCSN